MNASTKPSLREKNRVLVAVYPDEKNADDVVKILIDKDYQMDLISVLGKMHAVGDDTLGIYNLNTNQRVKAWGKQGAFWGGVWGALAAGLFVFPGLGPVAVGGFIVETIIGATAGASVMAGAGALSQLAVAFHRSGIPEEKIKELHQAIEEGKYMVMLRGAESEIEQWRPILDAGHPISVDNLAYSRIIDKN